MKLEILSNGVLHIRTESQYPLTSTFMRMQEFYESPKFRNQYFTVEHYMDWYASEYGNFTYCSDWSGFNVPSNIVRKFFESFKGHLLEKEHSLYNLLKPYIKSEDKFYLIGTYKDGATVDHELSHAWFFLDKEFKKAMTNEVNHLPLDFKILMGNRLKEKGYCKQVEIDEIQAYLATSDMIEIDDEFVDGHKIVTPWDKILKIKKIFSEAKDDKIKTEEED